MPEDVFLTSPRKSPAHRRSAASLRTAVDATPGGFSLAHELAVAMMPEPSSGSKLLAEEFGIEFDEGAEGIDGDNDGSGPQIAVVEPGAEMETQRVAATHEEGQQLPPEAQMDVSFGSPPSRKEQDAMEVLAQNLESTDNFLSHLRHLDADASQSSSGAQPALEKLASDVIRRINDTARDRETQVRELLECDREFRRIAGEVGGQDVLGWLEELPPTEEDEPAQAAGLQLGSIAEEEPPSSASPTRPTHLRALSQEWETDPDADMDPAFAQHNDDEDEDDVHAPASPTPGHTSFAVPPAAPRSNKPPSPAAHLADLRGLTTSLVASLTSVSEHAQVNGAATADAGRKLRALRNRLGGWRTEWEGAERSRVRIERWETNEGEKRVDGREVVKDHLSAFERALADAAVKTQAIMAAS
ncbi:hypothetical protein HMN09_00673300 [Mycena chlorophos]|uniref:Uncharacterized protein n=1 Tax=Mycena chlorophos TaxID=658473 RepID=A0A8H6SZM0_MYCCL|nr:hypothetical protein HMN09_00673300 [Mycena chlorophos]